MKIVEMEDRLRVDLSRELPIKFKENNFVGDFGLIAYGVRRQVRRQSYEIYLEYWDSFSEYIPYDFLCDYSFMFSAKLNGLIGRFMAKYPHLFSEKEIKTEEYDGLRQLLL